MIGDAPPFWWIRGDWRGYLLWPFSLLYGAVARRTLERKDVPSVPVPVLCVGNFTVGGSGKTPTVIAFAKRAKAMGLKPAVLTRGYGGSHSGPHLVDLHHDDARSVGDEALLIARHVPVMVSADRISGARDLAERGIDLIIMDDGLQSRKLVMDYVLAVVDAGRGLGNGFVIPAGPVRAPLAVQLRRTDALLVMGEGDGADGLVRRAARAAKPVLTGVLKASNIRKVQAAPLLAFAGIGDPKRFFTMLKALGGDVQRERAFPDHHLFSDDDLTSLMREAEDNGLQLVTTEKDSVRLLGPGAVREAARQKVMDVPVAATIEPENLVDQIITETRKRGRERLVAAQALAAR